MASVRDKKTGNLLWMTHVVYETDDDITCADLVDVYTLSKEDYEVVE